MRCLAAALLVGVAWAQPSADAPLRQTVSGGVLVNPAGLYARYDVEWMVGGGAFVGAFNNFLVYANGVGVRLGWQTNPGWLELHVDLAAEPGWYVKLPAGTPVGTLDTVSTDEERDFAMRYSATGQLNVNIQTDAWWLYNRTTVVARQRGFVEEDTFAQMRVDRELGVEQANALMYRAAGGFDEASLWVYGEYTVGAIRDIGTRPNRVSAGLVTERWGACGLTLNLDVFYSFAAALEGPGGILVGWYRF